MLRLAATGLALGLTLAAPSSPAQDIDPAESRIAFTYRQMNVPVEGGFRRWRARIQFDATRPERSRAEVEVEIAGIDTGSPEGDADAQRRTWFDATSHPTAKFVATRVRRLDAERYEVGGALTLKGRRQELTLPVAVRQQGGARVFEGAFPLKRLAFAIGEGVWADTDTVADAVEVRFRLVQRLAPGTKK